MLLIILTFSVAILSISNVVIKDEFSRLIIFTFLGYWLLSLLVSSMNPYGLYSVSSKSYLLILLHLLMFVFGYGLISIKKQHIAKIPSTMEQDISSLFSNKIFILTLFFSIFFVFSVLRHQFLVLATNLYSTGNLKVDILELMFGGSRLKYYYYSLVCSILEVILYSIVSFLLIYKRKSIKTILIILLFIIPMAFIGGGRISAMMIVFYMLISFYSASLQNGTQTIKQFISIKWIIIFTLLLLAVFIAMTYITFLGGGYGEIFDFSSFKDASNALLRQFVTYSVGPFRAFDQSLQNHNYFYSSMPFCGRATFGGADYLLNLVFSVLGISYNPVNAETVNLVQETIIAVGPQDEFNYAYTILYYYIQDFGVIGVLFFPFVFGAIIRYFIFSYTYRGRTLAMFCLIAFSFYGMIHSVFANVLTTPYAIILILLLLFLDRKSRLKISRLKQNIGRII